MKDQNLFFACILILFLFCLSPSISLATIYKKAKPAKSTTGFIDGTLLRPRGDIPFNRAWKSKKVDFSEFNKIYIAPINTQYLRQNSWWKDLNAVEVEEDIDELTGEFHAMVINAFFNDPRRRFRVVDTPGSNTLNMEIAVVELVPNKAGFSLLTTAAGPVSGQLAATVGGSVARKVGSKSVVAIEARLRDGNDDAIVAMFADREQGKGSIINVKNFTWYGHFKVIFEEWADQFVKVANKSPNDVIADTPAFTFKPW